MRHREVYCDDLNEKEVRKRGVNVQARSTLLYSRNSHNIVKQIYAKKKLIKKNTVAEFQEEQKRRGSSSLLFSRDTF